MQEKKDKKRRDQLLNEKEALVYAIENPKESGRQVAMASNHALSPNAVRTDRKRVMENDDGYTLKNNTTHKKHHT